MTDYEDYLHRQYGPDLDGEMADQPEPEAHPYDRPICGHKYCPPERCGYMHEPGRLIPEDYTGTCPACAGGYHDQCQPVLNDGTKCDCSQSGYHTPVSRDRYTVSGNSLRMWRLGPDGQPVGDPIDFPGEARVDFAAEDVDDTTFDRDTETFTMDLTLCEVDPALMALLTGQGTPPERLTVVDGRTRWQRFMDNHPGIEFTLYCLRRWTLDLAVDGWRWARRLVQR